MLVSGTPLHSYIHTLSAGYMQYVCSVSPFSADEQDRWMGTVVGKNVVRVLQREKLEEDALAFASGVARSLTLVARKQSVAEAQQDDLSVMQSRLVDFLKIDSTNEGKLKVVCFDLFLRGLSSFYFDFTQESGLFSRSADDKSIPLNQSVVTVFWAWLLKLGSDVAGEPISHLLKILVDRNDPKRGFAFQDLFGLKISFNPTHRTFLPVRRAGPNDERETILQLDCVSHFLNSFDNLKAFLFPRSSFVRFTGQGPNGFDFYFCTDKAHVFIDTTVSRLGKKLPEGTTSDRRRDVVLTAIKSFLGVNLNLVTTKKRLLRWHRK